MKHIPNSLEEWLKTKTVKLNEFGSKLNQIEQILGVRCSLQQFYLFDTCRTCTGYRSYAKAIECEHYIPYETRKSPRCEDVVGIQHQETQNGVVDASIRILPNSSSIRTHCESYNLANCDNEGAL